MNLQRFISFRNYNYRDTAGDFYQQSAINILANMMVPLAGLCDTAFLGHLEDLKYFAGVILGSILFDYLYRTLKFLRNSTTALAAQAEGKGDKEEAILALLRCGLIALFISLIIVGLQFPIRQLGFAVLSGSKDIELSGIDYFNSRIYGTPAVLLNFVFLGWFLGSAKKGKLWVLAISFVANGSNVLLDYLMISQWGWASWGAGLATAISQYLALGVGLLGAFFLLDKNSLKSAFKKLFEARALKEVLKLNGDTFVRFLALISAYSIFTNFSAAIGSESLAQNGLLIQIALLSQFSIQGIGIATQALIGRARGKKNYAKFVPLMVLAISSSLPLSLIFAISPQLFPETIFGLFGNHEVLSQGISRYTVWLLPLLLFTTLTFMFEAYFLGLKKGNRLRNSSLCSFAVFLPLAILAKEFENVNLLWLSLCLYMFINAISLGFKMIAQQRQFAVVSNNISTKFTD